MNSRTLRIGTAMTALLGSFFASAAMAAPVMCQDATKNHMLIDSATVSACMDAGVGNINGNPLTDDYLLAGGVGSGLGATSWSQSGSSGTFSLDATLWNTWSDLLIGFKFGTGNQPDEWFVYRLNSGVSSGSWQFVNVFGKGGGLSHTLVYGVTRTIRVPEPATLSIFGLGLVGFAVFRARRKH